MAEKLSWRGDEAIAKAEQAVEQVIFRGTESVRNEMIRLIQDTPKSGRIYQRGGVEHQASAPGEPPASDTGNLVNSITTRYAGEYSGFVTVGAEYGPYLEYGTQKMEPRPFARIALANVIDVIRAEFTASLRDALGLGKIG